MEKFINTLFFIAFCWFAFLGIACGVGMAWNATTFVLGVFNPEFFDSLLLDWVRLTGGLGVSMIMVVILVHIVEFDEFI